jgi:tyrosyl-tRNA synthetase
MSENVLDILQSRGLLEATTSEELRELAGNPQKPLKVYCGFDPTADGLHLGNMVAIMGLAWFQRLGHTPVALVGGATGMIGDPSGKQSERLLLDESTLKLNQSCIQRDLGTILLKNAGSQPLFLNNYDWFKDFSFLSFLRDVGKYFRVGVMMSKDSVRARLESEEGMSFTEFSYQLLQSYDFYHLYKQHGVTCQIGGSDQWGNITAGIEFVRKMTGQSVYGLTLPLLTKSDGQKFGKSEKGAIWMSGEKLSPFDCYQYLVRMPDADVIRLLKMLTFLDLGDINELAHQMKEPGYTANSAQRILADAITGLLHGEEGLKKALAVTSSLAPGKSVDLDADTLRNLIKDVPSASFAALDVIGHKLIDVVAAAGFCASKGEVRRLIKNGGVCLNNKKIDDENFVVSQSDFIENQFLLISLGKKHKSVIEIANITSAKKT